MDELRKRIIEKILDDEDAFAIAVEFILKHREVSQEQPSDLRAF